MIKREPLRSKSDLPEQVKVLQALVEQEPTHENLQRSIDNISLPTKIPLTRLQTEDDKSKQNRQKLLQQALAQAQAQSSQSSSTSDLGYHTDHFGFQPEQGLIC